MHDERRVGLFILTSPLLEKRGVFTRIVAFRRSEWFLVIITRVISGVSPDWCRCFICCIIMRSEQCHVTMWGLKQQTVSPCWVVSQNTDEWDKGGNEDTYTSWDATMQSCCGNYRERRVIRRRNAFFRPFSCICTPEIRRKRTRCGTTFFLFHINRNTYWIP